MSEQNNTGQDFNDLLASNPLAAHHIADMIEGASGETTTAEPRAWGFDVDAINEEYALVLWGAKAVVVKEQATGPFQDRLRVLSLDALNAWFANRHTEIVDRDGKIRAVTWAKAWATHRSRRQYSGIEFLPNPDGEKGTPDYLNLWRGFSVEPSTDGTYKTFRDHLLLNVCDGDAALFNYVFAWFAHMFQRPRERIGTAMVLRGRMGTGKSKVGEVFGRLIAAHYFQVDDPRYIVSNFNAHMASCLFLQAEEAVWAGDKHAEGRLKGLITSEYQMIEQKGIDPIRIRNFVRLLMTSNEDWVVPAGKDERRFCVLDVHPRCAQDHDYFREMEEELEDGGLARLLHDLLTFDLSATNLRQIPRTRALLEQKMRSLDSVESWWLQRLTEESPIRSLDTWPSEIAAASLYGDYVHASDIVGVGRKRDQATFGHKLAKLVPGIERTRPRAADGERRVYTYALPSLDRCRDAFEELLGQPVDWPASSASESEAEFSDVVPV